MKKKQENLLKKVTLEFETHIYELEGEMAQQWHKKLEMLSDNIYVVRLPGSSSFPQVGWKAKKYKRGLSWKKIES